MDGERGRGKENEVYISTKRKGNFVRRRLRTRLEFKSKLIGDGQETYKGKDFKQSSKKERGTRE
jgi:hypothetical protein